jgi:hypothetical protein
VRQEGRKERGTAEERREKFMPFPSAFHSIVPNYVYLIFGMLS